MRSLQLPSLEITSQFGKIGIRSYDAVLEIRQPPADMKIRQPLPDVTITKTNSKLEIDQSEAFADANLKPLHRWIKERAQQAKQVVLQDIAQEAREGSRLMKIESKTNAIAQIAKEQSEPAYKQPNIAFIPESPLKVKFHYTPSKISIHVGEYEPKIAVKVNKPIIKYRPGDVQVYLRQKPSIEFSARTTYDRTI